MSYSLQLVVSGPLGTVGEFRAKAVGQPPLYADSNLPRLGAEAMPFSLHALVPVPPEILARSYLSVGGGWDWELLNWGCTFGINNVRCSDLGDRVIYKVRADRPPIEFVFSASVSWPELEFGLSWPTDGGRWSWLLIKDGSILELASIESDSD
jgi:hypothetical protein